MKALLDGDIFCYRTAAASEDADENICILRLDRFIRGVLHSTQSDLYELFITGKDNFRYEIFPEYKANRRDVVKPKWLQACQEYVKSEWNAVEAHGCEADDHLGMKQSKITQKDRDHWEMIGGEDGYISEGTYVKDIIGEETVICSIDKDLLMIPGLHFNIVKEEFETIQPFEGLKNFYLQLLKGDATDGIPGVKGIGKAKAAKLLEGCETEQEMFDVCRSLYSDDKLMLTYGKCLWIWRKPNDIWRALDQSTGSNLFHFEAEELLNSTKSNLEETSPSLEPTSQATDGFLVAGQ